MTATQTAAFICYLISALIAFSFSFIYLTRREFMPYHKDAIQREWHEIDREYQVLILALMRAAGGGWLAVGVGMVFILGFPFRSQATWAIVALPLLGLSAAGATLYATLYVKNNTEAAPPVLLVVVTVMLLAAGFVLSII
ncbi:MAG: hypothetical protein PVH65_15000 [Chloroflexota bacterium]